MRQLIPRFTSISGPTTSISDINSRIKDLVSKGLYLQALELCKEQVCPFTNSIKSTIFILPSVIKACAHLQTHQSLGLQIHSNVVKNGFDTESTISNSLLTMYAKFSDTKYAHKMFDTMPHRDTISWHSMINCYIQNGYYFKALKMLKQMYIAGFVPKPQLMASLLSTCVLTGNFELGRAIHGLVIVDEGLENSVFMSTALIDLYWRCGESKMACSVFDQMEVKNEVSWTAMISGSVADQDYSTALDCFRAMQVERIMPNVVTLISVLPVCAELGMIKHGKEIHGYAIRHGLASDVRVLSALMHMYSECEGVLSTVELIFERSREKDVAMWSSVIKSYSQDKDHAGEAIQLFDRMQMEGMQPNDVTVLAVISACTNLSTISHGRRIHGFALKAGFCSELFVQNSLINMYAKCGCLGESVQVFNEMSSRDFVSWNALISAYGLYGYAEEALQLFQEMLERGIKADAITFLTVLSACNRAGLVEEGQKLFYRMMRDENVTLTMEHYACYIDLLGRAGRLEEACDVLCRMPLKPSTRIWSSLVSACKVHKRLDLAEMLAQKLIRAEPENAANYTLLSTVYAEHDNWLRVEQVWRDTKEKGLSKEYGFSRIELDNQYMQQRGQF